MKRIMAGLAPIVLGLAALLGPASLAPAAASPAPAAAFPASGVLWSNNKDNNGLVGMWNTGPTGTITGKSFWPIDCTSWDSCATRGDLWWRTGTMAVSQGHTVLSGHRFQKEHDLLSWNRDTGQVRIWKSADTTHAGTILVDRLCGVWANAACADKWAPVGFADMNGDGTDDILWWNLSAQGPLASWLLDGNGQVIGDQWINGSACGYTCEKEWRVVGVGDMNNDGHTDIAWGGVDSNGNSHTGFWLLDGAGQVTSAPIIPGWDPDWFPSDSFGLGDMNGDGNLDLVTWNVQTGEVTVHTSDGALHNTGSYPLNDWRCGTACIDAGWTAIGVVDSYQLPF
jgi:hypothetical protein